MMRAVNDTHADLNEVTQLVIRPSEAIVLTGELDLKQVRKIICNRAPQNAMGCQNLLPINIVGLKGVDVASGWPATSTFYYTYQIFSTTLAFYYMGKSPGQYQCNETTIFKDHGSSGSFFTRLGVMFLDKSITYDRDNPVCPFLFANAQIDKLNIAGLVNSFLVSSIFRFKQVNSSSITINSTITELDLTGYNYALDELLLNRLIFEKIQTLNMAGAVGSIQPDLFKSLFGQISIVGIAVSSLANFFHLIGLEWTGHLSNINKNISVSFSEDLGGFVSWLDPGYGYTYPNHDLCIFASFAFLQPQQKQTDGSFALVIPVICLDFSEIGCTDPAAWLTHDYKDFDEFTQVLMTAPFYYGLLSAYEMCWNQSSHALNLSMIETKINQCASLINGSMSNKHENDLKTYTEYYEIEFSFELVFNILAFVLIPLACTLGLWLNARVCWTVLKKGKKDLNENFYKYMALNSTFNSLFCLIYVLYPINYCLLYESGFFCSAISNSVATQVIKIVFQGYLGEVLKMCSNISYILITINRYMLVGKKHNFILTNISEWNMKRVIGSTVVFSLLINIGHGFQYRINYGYGKLFQADNGVQLSDDLYPSIVVYNTSFQVYSIVYFVVNFVAFFLINTCVEASLVLKMRKEIAEKRDRIEEEIRVSAANNSACSEVVNKIINSKRKRVAEDAKKETRAIKMVVANSLINFILRLPEILVFFSSNSSFLVNLINNDEVLKSSYLFAALLSYLSNYISSTMVSISYLCYILTFTTNVFINCFFNEKFKQHFAWWSKLTVDAKF
jgi:hypothetical protein